MTALIHQILLGQQMLIPLETKGIIDWLTQKNTAVQVLFRAASITIGIAFVIWQGIASRGAMAKIIISAVAAAIFIWVVFSVTDLKDRVGDEVNSHGQLIVTVDQGR